MFVVFRMLHTYQATQNKNSILATVLIVIVVKALYLFGEL